MTVTINEASWPDPTRSDHRIGVDGRVCVRCYRDLGPKIGYSLLPGYQEADWACQPPPKAPTTLNKQRKGPLRKGSPASRTKIARATKIAHIADIYVRDGRQCHYCGREMMPLDDVQRFGLGGGRLPLTYPTLDHVVPRSKGGTNTIENLVVACWECNVRKSDNLTSAAAPESRRKKAVDAARCELCHGQGRGWNDDRDKPCPDCRGAGIMSIDRYAELLYDRSVELAKLRKKYAGEQEAVGRLRSLLEAAAEGAQVWREREKLGQTILSQQRTIEQMGRRIEELGGGRSRLRVVEDGETA